MSVKVRIAGVVAEINDGEWSCEDSSLLDVVDSIAPPPEGYGGGEDDPDMAAARDVTLALGGEIINVDLPDYSGEEDGKQIVY